MSPSSEQAGGYRGDMVLLAESGYMHLACTFTGERAAKLRQLHHTFAVSYAPWSRMGCSLGADNLSGPSEQAGRDSGARLSGAI